MEYERIILELLNRVGELEDRVKELEERLARDPETPSEGGGTKKIGGHKYRRLTEYLADSGKDRIRLSFSEIENILGFKLSDSARNNRANWANSTTQSLACSWLKVGYITVEVSLTQEYVVFEKDNF